MEVWRAELDDRFECLTDRIRPYEARLTVKDKTTGEEIMNRPVSLSYDARFGPDVDDVNLWVHFCEEAVDKLQA